MLRYLLPFLLILPLFAIENNLFTGFGVGEGTHYQTDFWQQTTKDNSTCPDGLCIGNKTTGSYAGHQGNTFFAMIGDEAFFDKFKITGLRFYGSMEYANVSLGSLDSSSVTDTPARDKSFTTCTNCPPVFAPPKTMTTGVVKMKNVSTPQTNLFDNGVWISYALNLDFFINLPIDSLVQLFWKKMPFFKVGVYAGGGVEYATLRSNSWNNEEVGVNGNPYFASGSGFFANLGGSVYLGRHNRINIGVKIPYYGLNSQNWYDYGDTDPWKQQLLRQNFDISKGKEWRVSYVYLF
ncbi:outer membrane beta-barrel protein [Helicobacter cappadocius]|uniref:Outer membrane beta-barrel protein n=1 Tax=Helicobacter cappadocius TaxID=3063998 RepID=A0AA90PQE5_9HELI|nr:MULTISPECIES: outer membrane beta-barrel protein [unclassified Helicobacter]MDO7252360.1 outer membrane beta-barrel protein [Helicobacter sp. faydin-H75]MDP2538227.1 outer membrane beta-barrel protein [Helicobacter sp. faydin-H76]